MRHRKTFGISGISSDGGMNWATTEAWLSALNAANYLGYSDWRLPHTLPVNGTAYNYNMSLDGSTDWAENISAPGSAYPGATGSEMAYMFYNNLHSRMWVGYYVHGDDGPFENIRWYYWSETPYGLDPDNAMWGFGSGQSAVPKYRNDFHAWVVFDGDVGTVPIPGAVWLLSPGLIGLLGLKRKILG